MERLLRSFLTLQCTAEIGITAAPKTSLLQHLQTDRKKLQLEENGPQKLQVDFFVTVTKAR